MARMTSAEVVELHRLQPMTNVETLARALGISPNSIYDMIRREAWTATRVLRVGRSIKIPTADILVTLGLSTDTAA